MGHEAPRSSEREAPISPVEAAPAGHAAMSRRARWAWIFGIWTALGLFSLCEGAFGRFAEGNRSLAARFALGGMLNTWLWALGTPAMMRLARRYPMERGRWGRRLALHLVIGVVLSAASSGVDVFLLNWLVADFPRSLPRLLVDEAGLNIASYLGVVAACHTIDFYREWDARRLRAAELETQLVQARFQALETQLRPRFLFRALDNVAALVRAGENQAAVRTISGVGDLLRMVLRRDGSQAIPLGQELDFAERYLMLEQIRLRDRLDVHIDAAPATLEALVPGLILLPLVESAIEHGVEASPIDAPAEVELRAERAGDSLVLSVRDSGAGLPDTRLPKEGSLAGTQGRLEHLYGEHGRLTLSRPPEGGTLASLTLPFQTAPEHTT